MKSIVHGILDVSDSVILAFYTALETLLSQLTKQKFHFLAKQTLKWISFQLIDHTF